MLAGSKPYPPQNGYEHETLEHIQIGDGFYCMVNQKAEARPGKPRLDDRIKVVHVLVGSMEQREQDDGRHVARRSVGSESALPGTSGESAAVTG